MKMWINWTSSHSELSKDTTERVKSKLICHRHLPYKCIHNQGHLSRIYKRLLQISETMTSNSIFKSGWKAEKALQEREDSNALPAYEKTLNMSGHQGNTKRHHNEMPTTETTQMAQIKIKLILPRVGKDVEPQPVPSTAGECKSVWQLGRTVWLSIPTSYGLTLPMLCIHPAKSVHAWAPEHMYENVHSSAILRPHMETSWMSNSYFCFEKLWYTCIMKDLQQGRTTDDCFIQQQMNLRDMS